MSEEPAVSLADVYARSDGVVGRRIADEYVLVPIVSRGADVDSLFNLNRVGAFVWEKLDGKASGEQILEAMLERFEIDRPRAEADYLRFLAQLVSIRAVTRVSAAGQVRPTLR